MAKFNDVKSCSTCVKYAVCKYTNERTELQERLKSLSCNNNVDIFSVSMSCNEHQANNSVVKRGV